MEESFPRVSAVSNKMHPAPGKHAPTMLERAFFFCTIVLMSPWLAPGCSSIGTVSLNVEFPDQQARDMTRKITVFVLDEDMADCRSLLSGESTPVVDGGGVVAYLAMSYPGEGKIPALPVGTYTFFVQAFGEHGVALLRGCTAGEVPANGTNSVKVELVWVCMPSDEKCGNEKDDDCDGMVDEGCPSCQKDSECADENPCTIDLCVAGECHHDEFPKGTPCSDKDPCTVNDQCVDGACLGEPKDCSALGGTCLKGVCDVVTGKCKAVPVENGTKCDDGLWCTVADECENGKCIGAPRDCSDADDLCTEDVCVEGTGKEGDCVHNLVPRPGKEGPPGSESCYNGADDDCDGKTDTADASCIGCTADGDCDDGNPCTEDRCVDFVCANQVKEDGTPCEDGLFCTIHDECISGVCKGDPRECLDVQDACHDGICLEDEDRCVAKAKPDDTACEDGLFCTVGDKCIQGECRGSPRVCNDDDPCTDDSCNEEAKACVNELHPRPGEEGPPGSGSCANTLDDDCDRQVDLKDPDCIECSSDSDCDDGNQCTIDRCIAGKCINDDLQDGTECDDGMYCTVGDACMSGKCTGAARDCSDLSDNCHDGVCNEEQARCEARYKGDGTECDDGLFCTVNDTCTDGECTGRQRSCEDADPCTVGSCDDDKDECVQTVVEKPGAEGPPGHGSCTNGQDDDCDGEVDLDDEDCVECVLSADCDDGNDCTDDVCDRGVCRRTPVSDGSACDDGLYCNGGDRCFSGACTVHDGNPCDDGLGCTDDVCDEAGDTCSHPVAGGKCLIAGTCYLDGDPNPSEACEACSHDSNPSEWTWTEKPWELDVCSNNLDEDCDTVADGCCMGDGTFGSPSSTTVGSGPWYMVTADFDEDGIPDLATANRDASTITVLIGGGGSGRGDGTFTRKPAGDLASGGTPYGLATADMDGDGHLDLIAANSSNNASVSVLWGNGNGDFGDRTDLALNGTPTFPATGDFDDDGNMDLAVTAYTASVAVILGNGGARSFSAPVYYDLSSQVSGARSIVAGDFNGDDILDLAVAAFSSGAVTILYGKGSNGVGDGTFESPTSGSTFSACAGPTNITSADFNQDGVLDLALSCMNANRIGVLLGNGSNGRADGTFKAVATYATGAYPVSVYASDLNADNVLDLVFAEWGSASAGLMLGNTTSGRPDGTFSARIAFGAGSNPTAVAALDFNGDSIPDLAVSNNGSSTVSLLPGRGSGGSPDLGFVVSSVIDSSGGPTSVGISDLDSDNILDLAVSLAGTDTVGTYEGGGSAGRGDATFAARWSGTVLGGAVPSWIGIHDLNEDNVGDLVTALPGVSGLGLFYANSSGGYGDGTFAPMEFVPTGNGTSPRMAVADDVDENGVLDLLVADESGNLVILMGQGTDGVPAGTFDPASSYPAGNGTVALAAGDLNADSILDVVLAARDDDSVTVMLGRGSSGRGDGTFSQHPTMPHVTVGDAPVWVELADLNGDSVLDMVTADRDGDTFSIRLGNGSAGVGDGTFSATAQGALAAGDAPVAVLTVDLDSDGIPDLAGANSGDGTISLFKGNGDGSFSEAGIVNVGGTPVALAAAFLDWDPKPDLVVVDSSGERILVLRGTGVCYPK